MRRIETVETEIKDLKERAEYHARQNKAILKKISELLDELDIVKMEK